MENTLKKNNSKGNKKTLNHTAHVSPYLPKEYIENSDTPEDLDVMWLRWKCIGCGYVYEGVNALRKCPKCGNENPDKFVDVE